MKRSKEQTERLVDRACELIRQGNWIGTAMQTVGLGRNTLHSWRSRKTEDDFIAGLIAKLESADAEAEVSIVSEIRNAEDRNWASRAWLLERRWPRRWGLMVRKNVTDELELFAQRLKARLDDETYDRVLQAVVAAADETAGAAAVRH